MMITDPGNLGIFLGQIAWGMMVMMAITVLFRKSMIPRFTLRYRGWRYFRGGLAVGSTVLALWHSIAHGRHTGVVISVFFIALALLGFAMLAHIYRVITAAKPVTKRTAA